MNRQPLKVAALLFGSGMCALVYQTAWLRQFRLIFGSSTLATAAVLAIFMAGLGAGSAVLGKRADRASRPLEFYANLEFLIALSAGLSVPLLMLVQKIYIALGGSVTLGPAGATVVRLVLALLVLGIPTFLMGGTLPAAARAVESRSDVARRRLALLYGLNTLGAVTGALFSTFFLLEAFGNRLSLFVALLINLLVAVVARAMSRGALVDDAVEVEQDVDPIEVPQLPASVVYGSSLAVGFSFLLMELVWYRMLSPLLGGTTFMFGLILAIALLGIGLGGAACSLFRGRATAGAFALTCSLEAAAMIIPFALGDRIAVLTNFLRAFGVMGFGGDVLAWTIVTMIVVFPAAFISGVQFPILIGLLGKGREDVGRQVGATYAWNTAGAIAGSLAGGFGLMPLLTAPGCWRLVAALLTLVAIVALAHTVRARQMRLARFSVAATAIAILAMFADGPTAVWRHSGIGAKRAPQPVTLNDLRDWMRLTRRTLTWDADGRESSVALVDVEDYAMITNGKSDGSARGDAGTQVMSAMIGAILHGNVKSSLVIGLGTGSTAGWLGSIPQTTVVDAIELEPLSIDIARACAAVNHDVLSNPKVKIRIGDAREVLLTTRSRYDLIFSEPSNPYRAGIASLFTREYYEASASILQPRGVFLQWVQTYGIDAQTMQTIYKTISTVYPHVETWWTSPGDIVLIASKEPIVFDADAIRTRLTQEPYRSAAHFAWRVESAEGFLSHFVAPESVSAAIAANGDQLNTDDKTPIEFGFARAMGTLDFSLTDLYAFARERNAVIPQNVRGAIDWQAVQANRDSVPFILGRGPRWMFARAIDEKRYRDALMIWDPLRFEPVNSREAAMLGFALADEGNDGAEWHVGQLAAYQPIEADAIMGRLRMRQGRYDEAAQFITRALTHYQHDAWPMRVLMEEAIITASAIATKSPQLAAQMADVLSKPFAAGQWDESRRGAWIIAARNADGCGPRTLAALRATEPNVPWRSGVLQTRAECYAKANLGALAERAEHELEIYYEAQPSSLKD
jgi:spermidine synthase